MSVQKPSPHDPEIARRNRRLAWAHVGLVLGFMLLFFVMQSIRSAGG